MKLNNEFKRVVVTGYGAVTPLGATADESWQAMMDNRLGYRYVDKTALNIKTHFLGLVDNEPSLAGIPAAAALCPADRRRGASGDDDGFWRQAAAGVLQHARLRRDHGDRLGGAGRKLRRAK